MANIKRPWAILVSQGMKVFLVLHTFERVDTKYGILN